LKFSHFIIALFTITLSNNVLSQLSVATGLTPEQYVQQIVGSGIIVSNVTFSGQAFQIGLSDGSTANMGFNQSVVMAAGDVNGIVGVPTDMDAGTITPFGPGDADLLDVAQSVTSNPDVIFINSVNDAAVLEFDFVPSSNVVGFNFVFSSDEYTQWVNSQYNDAFGFFVSGPGITGPFSSPPGFPGGSENYALVPGTNTPITISTIYPPGLFFPSDPLGLNPQFYVDNENPPYADPTFTHNGFTVPMLVELNVICGETYHFKFAVADCVDGTLNTAVFIEAGSFVSDDVDVTVATVSGDTTIVEGCTDANFIFTRPAGQIDDTLIVNYQIGGVAIEGDDYNDLPDTVVFLPGEDSVVITLTPFQDGISEGFESVTISVELINICGDTIVSSGIIYIGDGPIINITESDTLILCASDSVLIGASASGGYAPYTYEWFDIDGNPIDVGDSIFQGISENGTLDVLVSATDFCDFTSTDTASITLNQTLSIDTILVGPATCEPDGYVSAMVSGETTTPQQTVYYSWTGSGGQTGPAASVWTDLASGWYYVTVEDAVCVTSDSAFVDLLNPPIATLVSNPTSGCGPLNVSFDYSSSENADFYEITFGDGTGDSSNELGVFSNTYDSPSSSSFIAQLVVSQGEFCKDSTTVQIQIEICGCMDPVANNYNEQATIDDGSCIYPVPPDPIVSAPNVFTPNGDTEESNEEFFLESENLSVLRLIIFNRWGNVVFDVESNDVLNNNPSWYGKTEKGKDAEEGVYFYKYEAVGLPSVNGIPGVEIQGHGFLHLIR
jgi:hypothetical protein